MNITKLTKQIVRGKGYVVLPDLLSSAEAREARELVLQLARKERQQGKLIVRGKTERLHGLIYKGDIFSKLVQEQLIIEIIEAILGEEMIFGGFSAHILYPQAQRMGIHVDYPYWAMASPYPQYPILEVQVIWLIDDFTVDNGAPLFAADTQKLAVKPDPNQFERTAQKITGKAGTAIISHGLCWHDTSENKSDRPRISLLGNYTPQYIHPLENPRYDFQQPKFEHFTPRLKKLLRHTRMSEQSVFETLVTS
ncbi:MAG TPA: phytanoyl-CoA dioxygenase family protein [Xenococcaceae cyanobacterium]